MEHGFIAEKSLGYAQSGAVDTATLVSSLTFQGQPAAGIPPGTSLLLIQAQTQAVRWRDDGTAPTTTVGYPLAAGVDFRYTGANSGALQFISQTAGAILNVVAYR
jgi:hypothetical protein